MLDCIVFVTSEKIRYLFTADNMKICIEFTARNKINQAKFDLNNILCDLWPRSGSSLKEIISQND